MHDIDTEQAVGDFLQRFHRWKGKLYLCEDGRVYSIFRGQTYGRGRRRQHGYQWAIKDTDTGHVEYSQDCYEDEYGAAYALYDLLNC